MKNEELINVDHHHFLVNTKKKYNTSIICRRKCWTEHQMYPIDHEMLT